MVTAVFDAVNHQYVVSARAAPFEGTPEIFGVFQSFVGAKGRLQVHDDWSTSSTGQFRQSNDAGGIQAFANQAAAADDVPDQESAQRGQRHEAGAEQGGDGSSQPRPGLGLLVEDLSQPAPRRLAAVRGLARTELGFERQSWESDTET